MGTWIEAHQALGRHPKLLRLAHLLGCNPPQAVGHLMYLWWWAVDYAADGDLTGYPAEMIARICHWDGDPEAFIRALLECGRTPNSPGFLEQDEEGRLLIHDWHDYAGRLLQRRERDKARYRRLREARRVQAPSPPQPGHPNAERTRAERVRNGESTAGERQENGVNLPTYLPTDQEDRDRRVDPPDPQQENIPYAHTDPPSPPAGASKREPKTRSSEPEPYSEDFLRFWAVYPRHKEKPKAYRVWKARLKERLPDGRPITADLLIEAARRYAEECRAKGTLQEYIKYPATFLGRDRHFVEYLTSDEPSAEPAPRFLRHKHVLQVGGDDGGRSHGAALSDGTGQLL